MTRRLLGIVLAVAGAALLVDAAVTVAWREPVTWLGSRDDGERLERRYADLERRLAPAAPGEPRWARDDPAAREAAAMHTMRRQADRLERTTADGEPIGRLTIPSIGASSIVVQGAEAADLKAGPGHYVQTALPAQRGTVGLAGHRTTYQQPFRRIDELTGGERVVLTTPYGRFEYVVTGRRIVAPSAVGVLASRGHGQRIVLTACHPLFSAAERIVVFGRLARAVPRGAAAV